MYKLIYFKAVNMIGFMSGIGKKTVEIDLSKLEDKQLIIIFGDNASGKSTFMSMVHPWHTPSDGKTKFVIPGKEGILIRHYRGGDGTVIKTKCIYSPKGEDGHTPKCYLSIIRAGKEEEEELNPTGNVTSYQALLYTYFGINKEFLSFSTYNREVSSIVKMTDTERKNSISTMIPNTKRFDVAFGLVNDKYKELRALIKNVSQKILSLRDEDSLRADLKRISSEIAEYQEEKDLALKSYAKAEGRMKELTKVTSFEEYIAEYHVTMDQMKSHTSEIEELMETMKQAAAVLHLRFQSVSDLPDLSAIRDKLSKYDRKIAKTEYLLESRAGSQKNWKEQLFQIEKQLMDAETALQSIQTMDIDDLLEMKEEYQAEIKSMEYYKHSDRYQTMSYNEVINLAKIISVIHDMIQALYDEYGELVTKYFHNQISDREITQISDELSQIRGRVVGKKEKKEKIYHRMIELEQYRKFQVILDQRPVDCTIDSCPFIANALQWDQYKSELNDLSRQYDEINVSIEQEESEESDKQKWFELMNTMISFNQYLYPYLDQIKLYLGVSKEEIFHSIEHANWTEVLDIMKLKSLAAVLSQKDRYQDIIYTKLPEIEHELEIAKAYGTNRELLQSQIHSLKERRKEIKEKLEEEDSLIYMSRDTLKHYRKSYQAWSALKEAIEQYQRQAMEMIKLQEMAKDHADKIDMIYELGKKMEEKASRMQQMEDMMASRVPVMNQLKLDLLSLDQLKIEKTTIERSFLIIDVMRMILQPGKGLRKELINIYLYDIYQTANQLLLNTFNGNLYLEEFVITDKEFIIPYVYNGSISPDINYASSSQQAAISIAIAMAILGKIMGDYGIVCFDEADGTFSPANRSIFIDILTSQMKYLGITQGFFITQHPSEYESYDIGMICFPGGKVDKKKSTAVIEIN